MNLSRRKVIEQLKDSRVDQPLDDVFAENLAARLKSLAVSGSQLEEARRGRIGRKALAVVGSIGIFTWVGVTGVAASVGLVATGNLPAPIQNVVSSVLEVAGIQVPRADEDPAPVEEEQPTEDGVDQEFTTTTLVDESTIESEEIVTPTPVETTVPEDVDDVVEQTPTTVARPVGNKPTTSPNKGQENAESGNSNNGNSGNSGNANNGNSGNSNNGNAGSPGNSGGAGNANNGNSGSPGNSGDADNANNANSGNANNGNAGQGNNGHGNGNAESNSETVVTAPAVLAPLMPVNEPARGNSANQGSGSSKNNGKNK